MKAIDKLEREGIRDEMKNVIAPLTNEQYKIYCLIEEVTLLKTPFVNLSNTSKHLSKFEYTKDLNYNKIIKIHRDQVASLNKNHRYTFIDDRFDLITSNTPTITNLSLMKLHAQYGNHKINSDYSITDNEFKSLLRDNFVNFILLENTVDFITPDNHRQMHHQLSDLYFCSSAKLLTLIKQSCKEKHNIDEREFNDIVTGERDIAQLMYDDVGTFIFDNFHIQRLEKKVETLIDESITQIEKGLYNKHTRKLKIN